MQSEANNSEVHHVGVSKIPGQMLDLSDAISQVRIRFEAATQSCGAQTYFDTDMDEGATPVAADCEVVVRAPVLGVIDNTEIDLADWLPV